VPAVSDKAGKAIRQEIRSWKLHLRSDATLEDLAEAVNLVARGWISYYGRYYPSRLVRVLLGINEYLVRWAQRKYRRLRRSPARAWRLLGAIAEREPRLFVHWTFGARPEAG